MFTITKPALDAIARVVREANAPTVPMVSWELQNGGDGCWVVGFSPAWRLSTAPTELVASVRGFTFLIDGPLNMRFLLDDSALDWVGGRFVFRAHAID